MGAERDIGMYRLLQLIGRGGMGEVWLAEHRTLGRRAAIKLLRAEHARSELVSRFLNEARAAAAISDPGIVQIFDFGRDHDGTPYLVMELLVGETLDERLRRVGTFTVPDAVRLMRQVATSLGAAHVRGIIHRDLKPENIFLVQDAVLLGGERAKILDFGIAKLAWPESGVKTQTAVLMGTPAYMSPEQCRGPAFVDARSDIYSLGCVLFAMVTGLPPFHAESAGEYIAMHLREPAPRASGRATGIPCELDLLIARCLEKEPSARFESADELVAALAAITPKLPPANSGSSLLMRGEPQPTTLSSVATSLPIAQAKRGRWIVGGALVTTLALVILLFAAQGLPRQSDAISATDARAVSPPIDTAFVVPIDATIDAPVDAAADLRRTDVPSPDTTKPHTRDRQHPPPRQGSSTRRCPDADPLCSR